MKDVEDYLQEAINNIQHDRAATKTLLMTLMKYMQISEDRHKEVGLIAAKYLETLQRSNEQLVKVAGLMAKNEGSGDLTDSDMEDIYRMINKENKDE